MSLDKYNVQELCTKAAAGDQNSALVLIQEIFADKLGLNVRRFYKNFNTEQVNEKLAEFADFILTPTENNEWRLRNLDPKRNPEGYISNALNNWILDRLHVNPVISIDDDDRRDNIIPDPSGPLGIDAPDDELPQAALKTLKEVNIETLIEALQITQQFTAAETFILTSYLIANQYKESNAGQHPLCLPKWLSKTTGVPEGKVYQIQNKLLERLRKVAAEIRRAKLSDPDE